MKPITWEELSEEQRNSFLMNGLVTLDYWYIDGTNTSDTKNLYNSEVVNLYLEKIKVKQQGTSYGITDTWLYSVLDRNSIKNMKVAIMGSISPWYESICLYYGGTPISVEYNVVKIDDSRLKMVHINDVEKFAPFDAAFSISSFEHDGLGRYGDPINPNADFEIMQRMKSLIKKDGFLFLAVPTGKDKMVWNAHRVYGKVRLPYLIDNWEMIDQGGFNETLYDTDFGKTGPYQPVIVLKNI